MRDRKRRPCRSIPRPAASIRSTTYHGVKVADPYRWLEDDVRESPEVADWIDGAERGHARRSSTRFPSGRRSSERLTELWNYERYSAPVEEGGRYFYSKNDGLQNQSVLYVADTYDGEGRVLIDPNKWSEDGTIALGRLAASDDGKLLAYARQEAGSDWQQIPRRRGRDGPRAAGRAEVGPARQHRVERRAATASTTPLSGAAGGRAVPGASLNQMIYFHKLGDAQADDQLIYRRPGQSRVELRAHADRRRPVPGARRSTAAPIRRTRCSCARRRGGRRAVDEADRRFRERVLLHRQRRREVLLHHRSRRADQADRGDGRRQAGPRECRRKSCRPARRRSTAPACSTAS